MKKRIDRQPSNYQKNITLKCKICAIFHHWSHQERNKIVEILKAVLVEIVWLNLCQL